MLLEHSSLSKPKSKQVVLGRIDDVQCLLLIVTCNSRLHHDYNCCSYRKSSIKNIENNCATCDINIQTMLFPNISLHPITVTNSIFVMPSLYHFLQRKVILPWHVLPSPKYPWLQTQIPGSLFLLTHLALALQLAQSATAEKRGYREFTYSKTAETTCREYQLSIS